MGFGVKIKRFLLEKLIKLIKKKEEAWITNFIPQHSIKGRRLYHRKQSYTPLQRLTTDFFDRFKEEGILFSESPETVMGMQGGFICSFYEKDGKHKGLAYRKYQGKEVQIETPFCPTRKDADVALQTYIRAFNR